MGKVNHKVEYVDYGSEVFFDYCKNCVEATKLMMNSLYGRQRVPLIKKVIFNDPATIVIWYNGDKTVVKCQEGDTFDPEKGLAMAIAKYALGNMSNFNNVFKKWLPEEKKVFIEDPFEKLREAAMKINMNFRCWPK